jgi:biotin synthase
MKVCSGGIVGLGEQAQDRASLLAQLANLSPQPESVPINMLVKVEGTPLANVDDLEHFEFVRCIAVARIMMPQSHVRLSAGREAMNEQMLSLCFLAGANSIFYGCKLLTTANPETNKDIALFNKLGINTETLPSNIDEEQQAHSLRTAVVDQQNSNLFYNAE